MRLSAPTQSAWLIAVILGGLGLVGHFVSLPVASENQYWLVAAGFLILVAATLFKKF